MMIENRGQLTDKIFEAKKLIKHIQQNFAELETYESINIVYLIWKKPYMTVGGDCFIHENITIATSHNIPLFISDEISKEFLGFRGFATPNSIRLRRNTWFFITTR